MPFRSAVSLGTVLLLSQGCVTGTAHMLPVAGNPLRAQAEACELKCHELLGPPTRTTCPDALGATVHCAPPAEDRDRYAHCIDSCPGARAVDGDSCPEPPLAGVICENTYRANVGGIIGGTVAVVAIVLLVGVIAVIASSPILFIP
jgi:hypothetical protein